MSSVKDAKGFTPFLVADRQASLRILSGLDMPEGRRIGIMTHANVFKPFKSDIKAFPCFDQENCGVVDGPCPYAGDIARCHKGQRLRDTTVIISDSGVFQKRGCELPTYEKLFNEYESMGVDYGIIMDVLKDKDATLKTAQNAIETYRSGKWSFNLIGVAQGNNIKEYIECYQSLKALGYEHIAIGGMLVRKEKSARYVQVRNEALLKDILTKVREIDPTGWLFALGCYSPKRHPIFLKNGIFGADYKGWIFQYNNSSPKRGNKRSQQFRFKAVRKFVAENVLSRSQEHRMGAHLLIVPCAKKKVPHIHPAPAINVYNGPLYMSLRKNVHSFSNEDGLDIMILSAKYGLIAPTKKIREYDQRMTPERAIELSPSCKSTIDQLVKEKPYDKIIVNLGADYLPAIESALADIQGPEIVRIRGRSGQRLHEMKKWMLS